MLLNFAKHFFQMQIRYMILGEANDADVNRIEKFIASIPQNERYRFEISKHALVVSWAENWEIGFDGVSYIDDRYMTDHISQLSHFMALYHRDIMNLLSDVIVCEVRCTTFNYGNSWDTYMFHFAYMKQFAEFNGSLQIENFTHPPIPSSVSWEIERYEKAHVGILYCLFASNSFIKIQENDEKTIMDGNLDDVDKVSLFRYLLLVKIKDIKYDSKTGICTIKTINK